MSGSGAYTPPSSPRQKRVAPLSPRVYNPYYEDDSIDEHEPVLRSSAHELQSGWIITIDGVQKSIAAVHYTEEHVRPYTIHKNNVRRWVAERRTTRY